MSDLSFLETDSAEIQKIVISSLENSVGEPLYPGDERRIFGDALIALIVAVFNQVNESCKKKMLQYASGEVLDALGERYGCTRLDATKAQTTLRFSMNEVAPNNVVIAAGTRVTPDHEMYFETTEIAVLQAGALYIDVPAEACGTGEVYNEYEVGTLNQLVDLVPYIDDVTNTVATYGGDNGEPYPEADGGVGDDHYRERIALAPTALSVAGPKDAYIYHAKSADASIEDVKVLDDTETLKKTLTLYDGCAFIGGNQLLTDTLVVEGATLGTDYSYVYKDELLTISFVGDMAAVESVNVSIQRKLACRVVIIPILKNGEIPNEDILAKVYAACREDDTRPMTDYVQVRAPEIVPYDIEVVYYTTADNEADSVSAIEGANGAIEQFNTWQCSKLGRNINPDKLRSLCLTPSSGKGCTRIDIIHPQFKTIEDIQIAKFSGNLKVSHIIEEE